MAVLLLPTEVRPSRASCSPVGVGIRGLGYCRPSIRFSAVGKGLFFRWGDLVILAVLILPGYRGEGLRGVILMDR